MEYALDPLPAARKVVDAMKARGSLEHHDLALIESKPVRYNRDFAFATVKTPQGDYGLAIDPLGQGGTKRRNPPPVPEPEPFPLAIGPPKPAAPAKSGAALSPTDQLVLPDMLAEYLQSALPALIEKSGWDAGQATVTSVPDLVFVVQHRGRLWRVSYNSLTGSVNGKPHETPVEPLSWRRFLIRMHLAHGYPPSAHGPRWGWAIVVDVMAGVMVYWGASGLLMWWQIKATRRIGIALLAASAVAATVLAVGMHGVILGG